MPWAKKQQIQTLGQLLGDPPAPAQPDGRSNWELLVLGCDSYLHWVTPRLPDQVRSRYRDLSLCEPTAEAQELAGRVRQYYLDFLALRRLKSLPFSDFRQKLYAFLMDQVQITPDEYGLIYKLPYFYEYDQRLLEIASTTESADSMFVSDLKQQTWTYLLQRPYRLVLEPMARLERNVSMSDGQGERICYWWRDQHNHAVTMQVPGHSRNWVSLMDSLFQLPTQTYDATIKLGTMPVRDTHQIMYMNNPRFVAP